MPNQPVAPLDLAAAVPEDAPRESAPRKERTIEPLFTAAVFLSAFLLFLVQPMFGKMVLPLLGGSPGVWNTCMLFFQVALLAGYLYADLGSRFLDVRRQWALHLVFATIALLTLPIAVASAPAGDQAPIPWLLATLAASVGLPFMVLAGTGPLLQRWFARTDAAGAGEPYHLYAASNLGSMLALLAYPLAVEPQLHLAGQSWVWSGGFVALLLLLGVCGLPLLRAPAAASASSSAADPADAVSPGAAERFRWVVLAFVPSTMLLAVTAYITTDLAAAPLFWVLPLALYLLSFVVAFARRRISTRFSAYALQPAVLAAVLIVLFSMDALGRPVLAIPLHLLALFLTGLICHGELSRRRPPVRHLTEFYLWIAVGGAMGGVFNVLIAPVLFDRLWEYPLALVLAALLRPRPQGARPPRDRLALPLRAIGLALLLVLLNDARAEVLPTWVFAAMAVLTLYAVRRMLGSSPVWLAACLAAAIAVRSVAQISAEEAILVERSFYGQFRVTRPPGFTVLLHGSTMHGAQSTDSARHREPLTYYVEPGPLSDVIALARGGDRSLDVGVVGLGTGSAAAYAEAGDRWRFYELDPNIERVARDPRYFTYLADAPVPVEVELGDARLSLERDSTEAFDLLVLDAFSSDAIPTHLLTREALQLYMQRLAPYGRIVIHISNRYIDLEPVLAAVVRSLGLHALVGSGPADASEEEYRSRATWVVVAQRREDLGVLPVMERWRPLTSRERVRPWTDDYSALWPALRW